jgi:seryl-tRNA synthetase
VGPRPELVHEMRAKTSANFYMYRPDQFMEYARLLLKQHVDQNAIDEVREIRRQDEKRRLEMEQFLDMQEQKLHHVRHERRSLEGEIDHLKAEAASISRELDEVVLGPQEGLESPSTQQLLQNPRHHRIDLEQRVTELESRKHELDDIFDQILACRNSLIRHGMVPDRPLRLEREDVPRTPTPARAVAPLERNAAILRHGRVGHKPAAVRKESAQD